MKHPASHDPSRIPMTILRICVWFVPGVILIPGILLALSLDVPWLIPIPLILCVFTAIGYFDMRLKLQIEKADPKPLRKSVLGWSLAFAFIQIIIAPAVALAVLYCFFHLTDRSLLYP